MRSLSVFLLCSVTVSAGEYAVLSNGFRIHADGHTMDAGVIQLTTRQGVIEVPAATVVSFEAEEYAAPPPAAAPPASAAAQKEEADRSLTPRQLVNRAAERVGLPPEIVRSVARAESGYRTDAVSNKGAIGLMQLMPGTAAALNADPHDPAQNAQAGALYLRQLLEKYDGDPHQVSKAIAAYNAGPGAVDKYHGIPPYRETVAYVNRVLRQYEKERKQSPAAGQLTLQPSL